MFTGIIQAVGRIASLEHQGVDARVAVDVGSLGMADVRIGDSIAVSGVCLTAVRLAERGFWADVSGETLSRTAFTQLKAGTAVNLEKSLTLSTPLGGHLVMGHVDGVGEVVERREEGRSVRFVLRAPDSLAKYIAAKGSVGIDGVSLTVNNVDGAMFDINIVPHTLSATTLGEFTVGRRVNLEVDVMARYAERLLLGDRASQSAPKSGITPEFLANHGFIR